MNSRSRLWSNFLHWRTKINFFHFTNFTKNNCFLLLPFIPIRLAESYSFTILYIRLRSKNYILLLITLRICSRNCLLSTVTRLDLLLTKITMLNKLELKIWSELSLFLVLWFNGTVFHFLSKDFKKSIQKREKTLWNTGKRGLLY